MKTNVITQAYQNLLESKEKFSPKNLLENGCLKLNKKNQFVVDKTMLFDGSTKGKNFFTNIMFSEYKGSSIDNFFAVADDLTIYFQVINHKIYGGIYSIEDNCTLTKLDISNITKNVSFPSSNEYIYPL